jgi:hypothetical protein
MSAPASRNEWTWISVGAAGGSAIKPALKTLATLTVTQNPGASRMVVSFDVGQGRW